MGTDSHGKDITKVCCVSDCDLPGVLTALQHCSLDLYMLPTQFEQYLWH